MYYLAIPVNSGSLVKVPVTALGISTAFESVLVSTLTLYWYSVPGARLVMSICVVRTLGKSAGNIVVLRPGQAALPCAGVSSSSTTAVPTISNVTEDDSTVANVTVNVAFRPTCSTVGCPEMINGTVNRRELSLLVRTISSELYTVPGPVLHTEECIYPWNFLLSSLVPSLLPTFMLDINKS